MLELLKLLELAPLVGGGGALVVLVAIMMGFRAYIRRVELRANHEQAQLSFSSAREVKEEEILAQREREVWEAHRQQLESVKVAAQIQFSFLTDSVRMVSDSLRKEIEGRAKIEQAHLECENDRRAQAIEISELRRTQRRFTDELTAARLEIDLIKKRQEVNHPVGPSTPNSDSM